MLESLGKVVADPLDRMGFFYCQINPNSRTQNVLRLLFLSIIFFFLKSDLDSKYIDFHLKY